MKLHLPLPLRTALLSAVVSLVGMSSSASGEKICGFQIDVPFGPASRQENYTGYDSLVVCHCDKGGISDSNVYIYDNYYVYVYQNKNTSALGSTYVLKIYDCDRIVFKNNESSEDYSSDVTGVTALAGGGAVTSSCNFYSIGDLIFSGNRATQGVGGAIDSDGDSVYIQSCGNVMFKDNWAKKGGGAIGLFGHSKGWFGSNNHYLHLSYNTQAVTFSNNRAGEDGGAISARYVKIEGNKGKVEFVGNIAGGYGGAIRTTGSTSYGSGNNGGCLFIDNNGDVIFRDNYAGIAGGAIYATGGLYSAYIRNNENVIFENNVGGAIYSEHAVVLRGNEEVLFKGNGVAIDTDSEVSLSTTESEHSSIRIYDSIRSGGRMYLNDATYDEHNAAANGTILFSGENALVTGEASCFAESGVVRLEKGARLTTAWGFYINGAEVIVGQHKKPHTALDVTAMAYEEQTGLLTYDLDYNMTTTQPLVNVGQYVNLIADSICIDDSGLNGNPAVIPLLSVGTTIGYNGKTYSFSDGAWSYTSNKVTYTLPMDEILVNEQLRDGAKLEWVDKTLYYTISDTGTWEYRTKGLGTDDTWRGDVMAVYDNKKDRQDNNRDEYTATSDTKLCWAAAASNVIAYWQDKYAVLYQGDVLVTPIQSEYKDSEAIFDYMQRYVHNVSSSPTEAFTWWFSDYSVRECSWLDSLIGIPFLRQVQEGTPFAKTSEYASWIGLGFSANNIKSVPVPNDDATLKSTLEAWSHTDAPFVLGFNWVNKQGEQVGAHAVTCWKVQSINGEVIFEYTDSDDSGYTSGIGETRIMKGRFIDNKFVITHYTDSGGLKEAVCDKSGNYDYHIFQNGNTYAEITYLYYIETPNGLEDMLQDYHSNHTLHWTGLQKDSRWACSSEQETVIVKDEETNNQVPVTVSHLARPDDGWKKECRGGGKTIYAHSYFTPSNASGSSFVFADSVNGVTVTNKDVKLDDYLDVSNVLVSGKGYRFEGEGELRAEAMTVSGNLTLADQVTIRDTPLSVSGVISVDNFDRLSPALEDCTITMEGGIIWCAGMDLGTSDSGPIKIGDKEYAPTSANLQMQGCTVNDSGVFGCTLDFGLLKNLTIRITDVYASTCKNVLDAQIYALLSEMNTMAGAQGDYAYLYQIKNADIVANTADVETCRPNISGSTLTITADGSDPVYLTVGSAGVMNAESAADITICETNGATVNAGETALMTVPAEEVYLTPETSITASELTVAEESCLTNEGRINGKVVVEAFGTLAGSGRFGSTTAYEGGRVMVGSSPGAPVYESLTMQSGSELIFCLDGSIPASADAEGWGCGTHSVLTVTQAGGLTVESGTLVSVGCSLDFLNASPLGDVQTLSLVQLSDAGSAEQLNALQSGTQFMLAEEDDTLSALIDVGAHVHDVQWVQGENNTLQLSFIVSSCPEDALVWTNGSGDGVWNESSQNWETLSGTASLFVADRNAAFYKGGTVTLNGKVTVGDVVVSTSENLRWEGSGGIAGSGTLVKEGRGELVIASDNSDFAGSVEIYGGRVVAASSASLGSATVVLNGGALEIAAEEVGNAIMNAGDSTLSVSSGITHQLKQSIYNTGELTLVGRFDVSSMTPEETGQNMRVDVVGKVSKDGEGSGFLRTGDTAVTVAGNLGDPHTVDASGAVILYKGQAVTMNNGVGIIAGQLHYDQYLLTGNDRATVSGIAAQAGNQLQEIRMTGGRLTVNQDCDVLNATAGTVVAEASRLGGTMAGTTAVEVSGTSTIAGKNSYSGGTILRDAASLSVGHAHALGIGRISNEGNGSITVDKGVSLTLTQSISNSGTLSLSGALNADKLTLDVDVAGYITLSGEKVEQGTGFVDAGSYSVRIVDGGKTVNKGVSIQHDDYRMRSELVLGEDGVARAGGGVDYSRFYLTGEDAVSVSEVDAVSESKGSDLLNVAMDGGELEVDADIAVEATSGSIVITDDSTLCGTIADADITAAAGDYTSEIAATISGGSKVTVNGGEVTLSGDNRYTGGTVINGGRLTAGSDTAFGTGEVELRGGVLELNRKALKNKLLAQGGIISGGSGFRGAVELNGSVGLRGNLAAASMTIRQGSVLTLNDSTISVSGSLTLGGAAVLNLNGSSFADGAVLITFGSLNGSEEQLTVEYGADSDKYGVEKSGNSLILSWPEETQPEEDEKPDAVVPTLDRESCDALVQSSWGVFTASHAFADAVGGQRSAVGCVGRERSVAWVSALGGFHRIDGTAAAAGSDIDLYGAAVGFEGLLTGEDAVGIAIGRLSGDVQQKNSGREMEQEGTYIGVYGTHLLAEFARNSSLSLTWSAVYGDTETEGTIGQEEMSLTQDSMQLNARLSWAAQLSDKWALNLFGGMEYFASESAENEESEEPRVRMGSIQNLRGELGIGARCTSGSTSLYGEVRYLNDMVRSNPYADINGVRGYGANPGRQGIGLTVGAQQELGDGWSVHASYSLEAMSEATMHAANIGAGLRF